MLGVLIYQAYLSCWFFSICKKKTASQAYHLSDKQFGSWSAQHFVRPDLGPNCLHQKTALKYKVTGGLVNNYNTHVEAFRKQDKLI